MLNVYLFPYRQPKATHVGKKIKQARDRLKQGNFVLPSPAEVAAAVQGTAWTAMQLAEWGIRWPPPMGWRERLRLRWEQSNQQPPLTERITIE